MILLNGYALRFLLGVPGDDPEPVCSLYARLWRDRVYGPDSDAWDEQPKIGIEIEERDVYMVDSDELAALTGSEREMLVRTNFADSVEIDAPLSGVTIRVNFKHRAPVEFSAHIGENDEDDEFEERLVITAGAGLDQWDDGDAETGPILKTAFPREHFECYCDAETGLFLEGQFCLDQDTVHYNSAFAPWDPPRRGHYDRRVGGPEFVYDDA